MTDNKEYIFSSGIHGFHVYRHFCTPDIGQELQADREQDNPKDRFTVVVIKVGEGGS